MLKSIQEEEIVLDTLRKASNVYPRMWDAYEAMCWIIAHKEIRGSTLNQVYHLHKQAGGIFGVPELTVLYTTTPQLIVFHAIRVG